MPKTLHILNGDATLDIFKHSNLPGEIVVWREILSEGPVKAENRQELFRVRAGWLHGAYHSPMEEYQTKVVREFEKLREFGQYDEVTLWFEFDLCDQINLIFLLSFFNENKPRVPLYLISPAEFPGYPNFKGIGELKPHELVRLTEQRFRLTDYDLEIGAEAWKIYADRNEAAIRQFVQKDHGQLRLLKPALEADLERFPDSTGQNIIDRELIRIVNSGIKDEWQIFTEFSNTWKIFGMTDLSIKSRLQKLKAAGLIQLP